MIVWKKSWGIAIILFICLIYAVGLLQDEQFIQSYTSWLPQRLAGGADYEDPIFMVLNSTDTPFNISSSVPSNG
jgi:hypothetical protein